MEYNKLKNTYERRGVIWREKLRPCDLTGWRYCVVRPDPLALEKRGRGEKMMGVMCGGSHLKS